MPDVKDEFLREFNNKLLRNFSALQIQEINQALMLCLHGITMTKQCTDLVVHRDDNVKILKYFFAAKQVAGLSKRSLEYYSSTLSDFLIEESPEIASIRFEDLTSEQILVIVERTMANSIFNRITNDIGNKIILLPKDRNMSGSLIGQMKDFVKGSVSDAVSNLKIKAGNIRQEDYLKIVDQVYKTAFDIMVSVGEDE